MKKLFSIILFVAVVATLFSFVANALETKPRKVEDQSIISWAEKSKDGNYVEVKNELKRYINKTYNADPEKIAFMVKTSENGRDYSWINVYFLDGNDWYVFQQNWTATDTEVDCAVLEMLRA